MDLQSTFHIEQVKFVNALNELMNKITNKQSLKWELQEKKGQPCAAEVKESFLEKAEWELGLRDELLWLKKWKVGIQLQTKSVMWEWASKCSGAHEKLPAILVKVLAAGEQAG